MGEVVWGGGNGRGNKGFGVPAKSSDTQVEAKILGWLYVGGTGDRREKSRSMLAVGATGSMDVMLGSMFARCIDLNR